MNESINNLLIKAQQSLEASELLLAGGYPDFSIARAYYTIFYLAEAYLATKNLAFSKHSAVISAFGREFIKTNVLPQEYHQYLKQAKDLRHLGDYGEINTITKQQAKIQIERAKTFLEFSQNYFKNILNQ